MRLLISGSWVRAPRWANFDSYKTVIYKKEDDKTPLMGFEPTTFELEVQRASPLRHSGLTLVKSQWNT